MERNTDLECTKIVAEILLDRDNKHFKERIRHICLDWIKHKQMKP